MFIGAEYKRWSLRSRRSKINGLIKKEQITPVPMSVPPRLLRGSGEFFVNYECSLTKWFDII